jgi:hypothetical protein
MAHDPNDSTRALIFALVATARALPEAAMLVASVLIRRHTPTRVAWLLFAGSGLLLLGTVTSDCLETFYRIGICQPETIGTVVMWSDVSRLLGAFAFAAGFVILALALRGRCARQRAGRKPIDGTEVD